MTDRIYNIWGSRKVVFDSIKMINNIIAVITLCGVVFESSSEQGFLIMSGLVLIIKKQIECQEHLWSLNSVFIPVYQHKLRYVRKWLLREKDTDKSNGSIVWRQKLPLQGTDLPY